MKHLFAIAFSILFISCDRNFQEPSFLEADDLVIPNNNQISVSYLNVRTNVTWQAKLLDSTFRWLQLEGFYFGDRNDSLGVRVRSVNTASADRVGRIMIYSLDSSFRKEIIVNIVQRPVTPQHEKNTFGGTKDDRFDNFVEMPDGGCIVVGQSGSRDEDLAGVTLYDDFHMFQLPTVNTLV